MVKARARSRDGLNHCLVPIISSFFCIFIGIFLASLLSYCKAKKDINISPKWYSS